MSEWTEVALSEVITLQRGHDLPTSDRRPGPVPIMGSFGVTGWHDTARAKGPGVTIGRSGASYGVAAYTDDDYWPLNTALYVTDFKGNSPRWVFHLLDLMDFSGYVGGSAQPSLNRNYIASIPVLLPPVEVQNRISGMIGALDDLIDTNRTQVQAVEGLARSLAASAPDDVRLEQLAMAATPRQARPTGEVEHYSLPAFDAGAVPEVVDGATIQSSKLPIAQPSVLVSRLNPKWERCWMVYPTGNSVASTEFVPLVGHDDVTPEEVWAGTSASAFWDQMRTHVTGTTGSHQRVDKRAVLTLTVPDTRHLPERERRLITDLVREAHDLRGETAGLTRTRDELLPLLMSGRVRVSESLAVA